MKYLTVVFLVLIFAVSNAIAQGVVQISTERNAEENFVTWTELTVTWDSDVVSTVPDHRGVDDDSLQEWYVVTAGGWLLFSFVRAEVGEYAIRWSPDGTIWSIPAVVTIIPPTAAIHKD